MVFVKSINGDALLVVDCQVDLASQGTSYALEGVPECLSKVGNAVTAARLYGVPVIWASLEFSANGVDADASRRHLFSAGGKGICIAGSPGAELAPPLKARDGEVYLRRSRTSAFFATALDVTLRRLGASRVVVCGLNTPTSVRCSAFDALAYDYHASVLRDAVAADKPFAQASNLADIERAGCTVLSTELYIASLVAKSLSPSSIVTGAGEGLSQSIHLAGTGIALAGEGFTAAGAAAAAAAGAITGGLQQLGGIFGIPSGPPASAAAPASPGAGGSPAAEVGKGSSAADKEKREREDRDRREKEDRERRDREEKERREREDRERRERGEKEKREREERREKEDRERREREEKEKRDREERERKERERRQAAKSGDSNPLAAPFLGLQAAAQDAVKATTGAFADTVSATTSAAASMGIVKEEKKPLIPLPGGSGPAWPDLSKVASPIEQAFKATGSAVADISRETAKATEHAYRATEGAVVGAAKATEKAVQDGARETAKATEQAYRATEGAVVGAAKATEKAVQDGANRTASFVSDTTASAVQATQNAAETIKQSASTPLGKKKSPLGPFGGS